MWCCVRSRVGRSTSRRRIRRVMAQPLRTPEEKTTMKRFESRFDFLRGWGRAAASGLLIALLAACSVEPTYKRPDVETPAAFKEAPAVATPASAASGVATGSAASTENNGTWKPAQPADDVLRGEWWKVF